MRIASIGHAAFAMTMMMLGVVGLLQGDFTVIWQPVPNGLPGRAIFAFLCAGICVAAGAGLLFRRHAALAARSLLIYLVLWVLIFRAPGMFHEITVGVYWSLCRTAVILAATWVLYAWFAADWDKRHVRMAIGKGAVRMARAIYGAAIIPFGIAHFEYVKQTASMVPAWLPAQVFWVYFTGAAFIGAGLAVLCGVYARLAVVLSALQMGLFLLLIWVPLALKGPLSPFQWGETLVSLALTAAAWVVSDSYRDERCTPSSTSH